MVKCKSSSTFRGNSFLLASERRNGMRQTRFFRSWAKRQSAASAYRGCSWVPPQWLTAYRQKGGSPRNALVEEGPAFRDGVRCITRKSPQNGPALGTLRREKSSRKKRAPQFRRGSCRLGLSPDQCKLFFERHPISKLQLGVKNSNWNPHLGLFPNRTLNFPLIGYTER